MTSLADRILKVGTNPYAYHLAKEDRFKIRDYIDTGNYALNTLICGDPFGGIPSGKVIMLAGPESTGKTYITIEIILQAQKLGYTILYYDTEGAQNKDSLIERGIDEELLIHSPISIVKDLHTDLQNVLGEINPKNDRLMVVIDSLGNLSTDKEFSDTLSGKKARDMTRAQELKALFRTSTVPAMMYQVPIIVLNHVYDQIGSMSFDKETSGGRGPKYAASATIHLSKAKEKESNGKVIGALISAKSIKNRLAKENQKVKVVIDYNTGLSRYSGLFDLALETGFVTTPKQGWYNYAGGPETNLRKKDFAGNGKLWDDILSNGFADALKNMFAYQSTANGVVETNQELEELEFEGDE